MSRVNSRLVRYSSWKNMNLLWEINDRGYITDGNDFPILPRTIKYKSVPSNVCPGDNQIDRSHKSQKQLQDSVSPSP
ncbi:hypothetical protein KY290_024150 [Solanum tuberosum]|uniref:Uncharacterized protein n=1 Tax=Solanum tuberosum TaxID=4113 RepID=A0ABQ7UT15_SOLTU|nr:hypothetical protein KY285_022925 [Solanum tuberosum]KAH0753880.1 hypothetical protein KY290_024150 [Solanum tuberosum]